MADKFLALRDDNGIIVRYVDQGDGTWAVKGNGTATTGPGSGMKVEGTVPSDTSDAGNPIDVSGMANTGVPTSAVTGQRKVIWVGQFGQIIAGAYSQAGSSNRANTDTAYLLSPAGVPASLAVRPEVYDGTFWQRLTGDVTSQFSKPPPLAKTDRSLVTSATSQTAVPANPTRSRLIIKNIDATNSAFVNLGAAAVNGLGSIEIAAKGILELTGTTQALNVIAGTGTPGLTIWEF